MFIPTNFIIYLKHQIIACSLYLQEKPPKLEWKYEFKRSYVFGTTVSFSSSLNTVTVLIKESTSDKVRFEFEVATFGWKSDMKKCLKIDVFQWDTAYDSDNISLLFFFFWHPYHICGYI